MTIDPLHLLAAVALVALALWGWISGIRAFVRGLRQGLRPEQEQDRGFEVILNTGKPSVTHEEDERHG